MACVALLLLLQHTALFAAARNRGGDGGGRPPKFVNVPGGQKDFLKVYSAHFFEIPCRAKGRPRPEVAWFKDGVPLTEDTARRYEPYRIDRWRLQIDNAR